MKLSQGHVIAGAVALGVAIILLVEGTAPPAKTPAPRTRETHSSSDESIVHGITSEGYRTTTRPMEFEACLRALRVMSEETRQTPTNILETSEGRMVRFRVADGSVLVTCSKPDRHMVTMIVPSS